MNGKDVSEDEDQQYYQGKEIFFVYLGQGIGCGIVILSIAAGLALVLWGWPNG